MKTVIAFIGKLFKVIGIMVTMLILVAILSPVIYFTWRAGQPMGMPEYDGRTYYELLIERRQAYEDLATEYQASHPNVDVKQGMCFSSELLMIAYNMPWSGFCTSVGIVPELGSLTGPNAARLGCGQGSGSWLNFPSESWSMYEHLTYDLLNHAEDGPVPYCRIPAP
jgi:hypothetical protein